MPLSLGSLLPSPHTRNEMTFCIVLVNAMLLLSAYEIESLVWCARRVEKSKANRLASFGRLSLIGLLIISFPLSLNLLSGSTTLSFPILFSVAESSGVMNVSAYKKRIGFFLSTTVKLLILGLE